MDYTIDAALLGEVQRCYGAMARFRHERQRNKRYTYGDQWGDPVDGVAGGETEGEYMLGQGSVPLKNNLIRRLVRNVIGIYASQASTPVCVARDPREQSQAQVMSQLLRYNADSNRQESLLARSMEEFLISGMVVHRKYYGSRAGQGAGCWTDMVPADAFFVDREMRDCRGWDCRLVGEMHDCTLGEVCAQFAHDAADAETLRGIYGEGQRCRVIEVWRREVDSHYRCHDPLLGYVTDVTADRYRVIEQVNRRRRLHGQPQIDSRWVSAERWRYYFLAPTGHVLASGVTPYAHGEHPYVIRAYPMIDGEVHSFVADVIDQQRYTNRLITLYDWILRASAKGVLLVPEDCIPRGMAPSDFADAWSRFNGVVVYHPSSTGAVPQQVSANSTNIGIAELLNLQLKFFEDISGVNSALQGNVSQVTSAALFGQQTQNATTTLLDVLNTFGEFVRDGAYKDAKIIQQYYDAAMIRRIVGTAGAVADLDGVEFDLSIRSNITTPQQREQSNQTLLEIWRSGQITLRQMLDAGDFPFADKLIL